LELSLSYWEGGANNPNKVEVEWVCEDVEAMTVRLRLIQLTGRISKAALVSEIPLMATSHISRQALEVAAADQIEGTRFLTLKEQVAMRWKYIGAGCEFQLSERRIVQ